MKADRIIFATGNEGKMKEIRMILADMKLPIQSMKEADIHIDIEENGQSFEENALIKARAVATAAQQKGIQAVVLADDSGLEIDYLNKEPGMRSRSSTAIVCSIVCSPPVGIAFSFGCTKRRS